MTKLNAEQQRCDWCKGSDLYKAYHDKEWGFPKTEDTDLFECLTLEIFQAGLSWITILKKREHFREAFDHFNFNKIATYDQNKIDSLLQNKSIIRNKLKINATITNAISFIAIQKELGSFSKYIWNYVDGTPIKNKINQENKPPTHTPLSEAICKDLKKRGFKFIGPTIIYAYMQSIGMVNDHETNCFRNDNSLDY